MATCSERQEGASVSGGAAASALGGRANRLVRKNQFDLVRSSGMSVAGRLCVVNVLRTPPDGESRAAFSISIRYSRLAVERNRARRLFREAYRRLSADLEGCWVVFIPRRMMKAAKMDDVLADASESIGRIFQS